MKKNIVIAALLLLAVFSVCALDSVVVLRDGAPLRVKNADGKCEYASSVGIGKVLECSGKEKGDVLISGKVTEGVDLYLVTYNKKNYYIEAKYVSEDNTPSVVTGNAVLFTKPSPAWFRNAFLLPGQIVVVERTVTCAGLQFAEVTFFDTADWVQRSRWVLADKLSSLKDDVLAAQCLTIIDNEKDEDMKKEQIENAMALETSDGIKAVVKAKYNEIYGISVADLEITVFAAEFAVTVAADDGSRINVRDIPGVSGNVIGQFESGSSEELYATKQSVPDTVGGLTNRWYYITSPELSGWVFGAYVQGLE